MEGDIRPTSGSPTCDTCAFYSADICRGSDCILTHVRWKPKEGHIRPIASPVVDVDMTDMMRDLCENYRQRIKQLERQNADLGRKNEELLFKLQKCGTVLWAIEIGSTDGKSRAAAAVAREDTQEADEGEDDDE